MIDVTTTEAADKKAKYARRRPKVPPFARYRGTSAWRDNRVRVRAYEWFMAKAERDAKQPG